MGPSEPAWLFVFLPAAHASVKTRGPNICSFWSGRALVLEQGSEALADTAASAHQDRSPRETLTGYTAVRRRNPADDPVPSTTTLTGPSTIPVRTGGPG